MSGADAGGPAGLHELRERLGSVERMAPELQRIAERAPTIEDTQRSWIAIGIIAVFVLTVATSLGTIATLGASSGHWDTAASESIELLRSVVLPVVTLVLGYYFGRSARI